MPISPRALFERLASLVPGYTGYADREGRRETDQALRRAVAQRLSDRKLVLDRLIAEAARSMRFDALEPLESVKRRLDRLADVVRLAPAGYAALFADSQVRAQELDLLMEHDVRLRDAAEELGAAVDALALGDAAGLAQTERLLAGVEDAVRRRDELLKGVA